jgi:putative FmdB family regulatory protein
MLGGSHAGTVAAAIITHPVPIYEYKCDNGHVFDVIQKMADESLTECQECGAPAVRVLHPVAVHFKGSGFYNTDYGKKKGGGNGTDGSKESVSSDSGSDSSSTSSDSKPPESKSSDTKAAAPTAGD